MAKPAREPRNLERMRTRIVLTRFEAGADPSALAAAVQKSLGYVPPLVIPDLADKAGVPPEAVLAAVETDEELLLEPRGRQRVTICTGRTCARWGGAKLVRIARQALRIELFRTTPDDTIRLEPFKCMGQCAMAPNIKINGSIRGAMTEERFKLLLAAYARRP